VTSPQGERRRRVPAMAPEDRRAALIAATVPLLYEFGPDVSTRKIAEAAGVAEGTIFGVFPDKQSLIVAAMMQALDPRPTLDALAEIDPQLGLRRRMVLAADLIVERFTGNADLMATARRLAFAAGAQPETAQRMMDARRDLLAALTRLIEPDRHQLRRSPAAVARLLLLFCGANTFGPFGDSGRVNGDEMVSLLLDGVLADETPTETTMPIPLFGAQTDTTGVP
jgi:AcrR family transcriptional regulator